MARARVRRRRTSASRVFLTGATFGERLRGHQPAAPLWSWLLTFLWALFHGSHDTLAVTPEGLEAGTRVQAGPVYQFQHGATNSAERGGEWLPSRATRPRFVRVAQRDP